MGLLWLLPTSVMRKSCLKKTLALRIQEKNSRVFFVFSPHSTLKVWREGRHQSCQVFIHLPPARAGWCWHITTGKTSLDNNQRKCIRVSVSLVLPLVFTLVTSHPDSRLVFIDLSDLRSRIFSFYFLSLKKVRKLQIRFQVFIVIFIFISEFNKFVGFLWCQLFIGLSRLIPWQFSSRDEFYWFEKRTSFIAPLFLLLRKRTKRKRARSSWR